MSGEARYQAPQAAPDETDPKTELLDLYEDLDGLLSLALDVPAGPRKLELAFGVAGKLNELTRRINALSAMRPDLINALESSRRLAAP